MVTEIILLIVLICIGLILQYVFKTIGKTKLFELIVRYLVNIVYYILIPLSFIKTYGEKGVTISDLGVLLTFVIYLVALYLINKYIQTHIARTNDKALLNAIFITSAFPNSVFLGFPISMLFFNDIKIASTLGLVTLILNIIIPDFMAIGRASITRILTLPALIGFMIGITIHYAFTTVVNVVSVSLQWATLATSYLATTIIGMRISMEFTRLWKTFKPMIIISLYRFLLAPLIAMIMSMLIGMDWRSSLQLVLTIAMPPAVMNTLIAQKYGWYPDLVATITFILTILFIPVILLIYIVFFISI